MKLKWFGVCSYCTLPSCPAFGLLQVPVEKIPEQFDYCSRCNQYFGKENLYGVIDEEVDREVAKICNDCFHKELLKLNSKKNEVPKSKGQRKKRKL
jgi:hypothetical protein